MALCRPRPSRQTRTRSARPSTRGRAVPARSACHCLRGPVSMLVQSSGAAAAVSAASRSRAEPRPVSAASRAACRTSRTRSGPASGCPAAGHTWGTKCCRRVQDRPCGERSLLRCRAIGNLPPPWSWPRDRTALSGVGGLYGERLAWEEQRPCRGRSRGGDRRGAVANSHSSTTSTRSPRCTPRWRLRCPGGGWRRGGAESRRTPWWAAPRAVEPPSSGPVCHEPTDVPPDPRHTHSIPTA